jgi:hypothetical protein
MTKKLSRRQAIKALAAAGAVIAATPILSQAFGTTQKSSEIPQIVHESKGTEPLVIVVKRNELIGFRGLEEVRVRDAALAAKLNNEFQTGTVKG